MTTDFLSVFRDRRTRGRILALCLSVFLASSAHAVTGAAETGEAPARTTGPYYVWIQDPLTGHQDLRLLPEPDKELWNDARIDDYVRARAVDAAPPLGVLSIPRLGVEAPIFNGTDEFNLDRGLGRIRGMARLNEHGNLGVSGHRDGFFRVLKDIQAGDKVLIRSPRRVEVYEVSSTTIVDKHDTSPLAPSEEKMLTLVTCFPFYYVGHAPQRFIVTARSVTSGAQALPPEAVAAD